MENAPFYADIADGPDGGQAWWLTTSDDVRIRVGLWNRGAPSGTVLLFPGRTEYIEKYGRAAQDLAARGLATFAIDWRGQGLADRLTDDPATGHVHWFADYQKDVSAMIAAAQELNLPRPFYLVAHSMGGCIGLRALHEGLAVDAAAFSAPMWGIGLAPATRPAAWALAWGGSLMGMGHKYAPGTDASNYVTTTPFEGNMLTTDRNMWDYMVSHASAHPEISLGGPSLRWLHEALKETSELDRMDAPNMPTLTLLGTNERIVDANRITTRMARWLNGVLEMVEGAEHEVLMETPATRGAVFDHIAAFFAEHAGQTDQNAT